ncbi:hypothetical protein [Streptomyces canus]|uniref:hypothetical protein n=1 Tax=Streptomyces canus TaxID=58343 RepID=UPI00277FE9B5|nr:hypothetical protein [Streptomyces canus]MDQ0758777.1 hypothetical protein [Streptomyces canus]
MLSVTYEAVSLARGRLADIDEDRGRIRVRVAKTAPLADVVRQLNIEIDHFLSTSQLFQLWKDEIVSRATPDCSLSIIHLLHLEQPEGIVVREKRGIVTTHIDPALTTEQFAAAMNPAIEEILDGGQWFQMYAGEIIDMSPEELTEV